jgi:hypothetical protein
MSSDEIRQIHSQLSTSQSKHTYFLLAISASAIALSIQLTRSDSFSYSLVPLGLALVSWAASFFCGCRHIDYVHSTLYANGDYLRVTRGEHPEVGSNASMIEAASKGIASAMEYNADKANDYAVSQFRLLIGGGALFLIWHLVEMLIRTGGN